MDAFPSPTRTWHTTAYEAISPTRPELSAKGKRVVITGGGIGIGVEVTRAFAKAGAPVIGILGRTEAALVETKAKVEAEFRATKVVVLQADLLDEGAVTRALRGFSEAEGLIDVFVHNAGYLPDFEVVRDADVDGWWRSYEVNVKGSLIAAKAFLPLAAPNAVLIASGSAASALVVPKASAYVSAKFAESRFFEFVQVENPHIRVHNIHPGTIATRMMDKTRAAGYEFPEDDVSLPAAFTVWVASPEAAFTKGKYLWCNWDVEELREQRERILETDYLTIGYINGWPFQG
ncbi:putative NADP(+)-dependent dehydrogenase [Aspergillus pseudoustus]|uniref:NADP(+)-dependent dehydrogenase n=1 Tax=Aspergillus pseudoustus TaxID=1810923 RepID=A0ABR4JY94_9EURO